MKLCCFSLSKRTWHIQELTYTVVSFLESYFVVKLKFFIETNKHEEGAQNKITKKT